MFIIISTFLNPLMKMSNLLRCERSCVFGWRHSLVLIICHDARLTAGEGGRRGPKLLDGEGQQGHAHALAHADQQIELPSSGYSDVLFLQR